MGLILVDFGGLRHQLNYFCVGFKMVSFSLDSQFIHVTQIIQLLNHGCSLNILTLLLKLLDSVMHLLHICTLCSIFHILKVDLL